MCNWNDIVAARGSEYSSDIIRQVNKFDVWICDLGVVTPDRGNTLGNERPCLIVQSQATLNPKNDQFIVAPLRSYEKEQATDDTVDDIVIDKSSKGRFCVPCRISPLEISFIDISQIRQIPSSKLKNFVGNIYNKVVRDEVNKAMFNLLFSREDIINFNNNVSYEPVPEQIQEASPVVEITNISVQEKPIEEHPKWLVKNFPTGISRYYELYKSKKMKMTDIAKKMGFSYSYTSKLIKSYEITLRDKELLKLN